MRQYTLHINVGALVLLSFIEALQALIIIALISSFVSISPTDFIHHIFPVYLPEVRPEREMLLYRIWVFIAVGLQTFLVWLYRRRITEEGFYKNVLIFTAMSGTWVFIQLFVIFKLFIFGDPWWARGALYIGIGAALLSKVFWPELRKCGHRVWIMCISSGISRIGWLADMAVMVLIAAVIYVPDIEKVLARAFVYDRLYHIDGFIMAPAWAYLKGLVLNIDVISQYGSVIPALFGRLAVALGGLTYQHVLMCFIWASIIYFWMLYALLRSWLGWRVLSAAGVIFAVKCQMFHWGVMPIIWQFLTPTVARYFFDVIFLYLLWRHINSPRVFYLCLCSLIVGLALGYMTDTGAYLMGAFVFYILLCVWWPAWYGRLNKLTAILALVAPFAVAVILLYLVEGSSLLTRQYWINTFEHMGMFLQGWGALPVTDGFKDKFFYPVFKGLIIPVVYLWTMLIIGSQCFFKRMEDKHLFVTVLCVYGLGLYHYYIVRSAVSSYEVVGIPFVLVLCFWVKELLLPLNKIVRTVVCAILLFGSLIALMTNMVMMYYPNILSLGRNDWKQEEDFFHQQFDFSADARLISSLTPPANPAAVISSFETQLLIEANRRPFFYYFPLMESSHWNKLEFRGTYLHTRLRMQRTLDQMQECKPNYVFVEKRLFLKQIPASYYKDYETLTILMEYLTTHYQLFQEGKYLVALRRGP